MEHKKSLVILNECFPFDKGESFMENEIPFACGFDRIYLCPCQVSNFEEKRVIADDRIKIIASGKDTTAVGKAIKTIRSVKCFFHPLFWKETGLLIKSGKLNFRTFKSLLSFLTTGMSCVQKIKRQLRKDAFNKEDSIIFYSYWMFFHAYIAIRLKKKYPKSRAVSRCHRFDLYEYRNSDNYIPLRAYILENLDTIFSISSDGKNYLEKHYPNIRKNIVISSLGTMNYGISETNPVRMPFKIVSCSWVSPVKRVWKIADALSQIEDIQIEWTHYGSGEQFEHLKKYAAEKLGPNICANFAGTVSNPDLMLRYQNNDYHLFVNVSESEGVPVSIMEAMSFGIPVVATDVGGVGEIVSNRENGLLLEMNFFDNDLANAIREFFGMNNAQYSTYRYNARRIWEEKYNATKNFTDFYDKLGDILICNE